MNVVRKTAANQRC